MMKKLNLSLCVFGLSAALFAGTVHAQHDPAPDSPPLTVTAEPEPAPAPSPEPVAAPAAEPATDDSKEGDAAEEGKEKDLLDQAKDTKEAYDKVKSASPEEKKFAIAGLIAVALNLLLTGLKRGMKLTKAKKKWLPYVALGLGVVIAVVERYALSGTWFDAILYGGAGPGAVFVQELVGAWKKEESAAEEATPA